MNNNAKNCGAIMGMTHTIKGHLLRLEGILKHEENPEYRERVGLRIIKDAEALATEIYTLADNIEL